MGFVYTEQYYGTQPCDRLGTKYDRAAWRQEQLNGRAEVADEWENIECEIRELRRLPLAIKQQIIDHYKGELRRYDALLGDGDVLCREARHYG